MTTTSPSSPKFMPGLTSGIAAQFNDYKWIHPSSYIDSSAKIGAFTTILPMCYIGPGVQIGKNCIIGPGACIGQPGFGYEKDEETGAQRYREHSAGVVIDDDVHIGANACVDQGRHRPTRIGRGTRVDNLVHIAHNVWIGEDCLIIACSMLAGTVVIGDRSHVAPSAAILDHINVGEDALVGLGAVVVKDVPHGMTVKGVPAR